MQRSLFDIPVELDLDLPTDKIRLHPDVFLRIENQGIRIETIVINEVANA